MQYLPILIGFLCLPCTSVRAQSPTNNWEEVSIDLPYLGTIQPRSTHETQGYPWSVGGETMDRDYTLYDNWKQYVEPLGITQIRLQSGWAKTEKLKGEYDFAWLDHIVRDLVKRGVKPWLSLSYGNPNYKGGGGTLLGAALPTTGEAYAGWQNYVRATVNRYKDVVDTWEIWNEPNNKGHGTANGADNYGKMIATTGGIIRELQPEATIIGFASAGHAIEWTGATLRYLRDNDALDAIDLVAYHPYRHNPDETREDTRRLRDTVSAYAPRLGLYQGENGAPSEYRDTKALSKYAWTELSQAKWFLRRAINDRGQGIGTNIFSIVDLQYPDEINRKGLLLTNDNKEVVRPKHAYYAVQNLVTVLDHGWEPLPELAVDAATYQQVRAYGFQRGKEKMVALWLSDNVPSDFNPTVEVGLTFDQISFTDPVYIDLRTGVAYDIPSDRVMVEGEGLMKIRRLPLYDSPVIVTERATVADKLK